LALHDCIPTLVLNKPFATPTALQVKENTQKDVGNPGFAVFPANHLHGALLSKGRSAGWDTLHLVGSKPPHLHKTAIPRLCNNSVRTRC